MSDGRIIGIRHRIKKTKDNESRPTQLCIREAGKDDRFLDLESELFELDFANGKCPIAFRASTPADNLSALPGHHMIEKGKGAKMKIMVPESYDGYQAGDTVLMTSGSGDYLSYHLARMGQKIGAKVLRIFPYNLAKARQDRADATGEKQNKDNDAALMADLFAERPELFMPIEDLDMKYIRLQQVQRRRTDAKKDRIAYGQRMNSRLIGIAFCGKDGILPEGAAARELEFAAERAKITAELEVHSEDLQNTLLQALQQIPYYNALISRSPDFFREFSSQFMANLTGFRESEIPAAKFMNETFERLEREENKLVLELKDALDDLPIYSQVLCDVTGIGPKVAAPLLAAIGDVRSFSDLAKLKKFVGVHTQASGEFVRRTSGQTLGSNPEARQALFLIVDQFNKRPNSVWGQKQREIKATLRAKHARVEVAKKYSRQWRNAERLFLGNGLSINPADYDSRTVNGILQYLQVGESKLLQMFNDGQRISAFSEDWQGMLREMIAEISEGADRDKKLESSVLYSDGHILKMSLWRAATKFVQWLYYSWNNLNDGLPPLKIRINGQEYSHNHEFTAETAPYKKKETVEETDAAEELLRDAA